MNVIKAFHHTWCESVKKIQILQLYKTCTLLNRGFLNVFKNSMCLLRRNIYYDVITSAHCDKAPFPSPGSHVAQPGPVAVTLCAA